MATQSSDYTYASAKAASIPATVGILQLQDRGHSFWRRSATEPPHPGWFQSADGAWWELMRDQTVTPFMFGAAGDGGASDDTETLQKFFDFCDHARVTEANWEGQFGVSASLYMGGHTQSTASSPQEQARFTGEMSLLVKSNITGAVVYNRTRGNAVFDRLNVGPHDALHPLHHISRSFDFGILFDSGASQQTWSNITVGFARIWGVFIQTYGNLQVPNPDAPDPDEIDLKKRRDNTFSNTILNCFFYGCGSGAEFSHGGTYASLAHTYQSAAFTVASRNQNPGSFAQSTVIDVSPSGPNRPATPPELAGIGILRHGYEIPIYARINDQHYKVVKVDYVANQVHLFPTLPSNIDSGTIHYVFGGGFGSVGGDAGLTSVKGTASVCATGCWNGAQYPGYFDVTVQHNVFGYTVGAGVGAVAIGGSGRVYFEGNDVDLLWEAASSSGGEHSILAQSALNPEKIKWWAPRSANGSLLIGTRPEALQINFRGRWLHTDSAVNDPGTGNYYLGDARFWNPPEITSLRGPYGFAIRIQEFAFGDLHPGATNSTFRDKFGFRAQYFLCTGSNSPNGAPAGDITVHRVASRFPPYQQYGTLNGASSDVTLSGPFTGPVLVCVEQATTGNDDYFAYVVAGKSGSGGLSNDSVVNAYLDNMAANTIKGRSSGTGDPQDLTPGQARAVIASDTNNGGLFLAGDGTFKAVPSGASWTVNYESNRPSYYNLTPPHMTHVVFDTSAAGFHTVFLQNVATGTMVRLSRLRGGQTVSVNGADLGQSISRRTGSASNSTIADGGTVFLTKVGANQWVGEGDFEN